MADAVPLDPKIATPVVRKSMRQALLATYNAAYAVGMFEAAEMVEEQGHKALAEAIRARVKTARDE